MAGPLEGLTIVDASWGMPGSVTTLLLADHGARVIKVERPGGGPDRNLPFRKGWERGKLSVELDLGNPGDAEVLKGLLGQADGFVESFGPGRGEALGLGYDTLHAAFPHLVHCSITGYGREGPLRDRPGYDCLVAARLGLMGEQQEMGVGFRDGPVYQGHPMLGYGTAFLAAVGILSAVRARRFTGAGQLVDVSMLDGMMVQSPMNWWWNERGLSYVDRNADKADGDSFGYRRLITRVYEAGDGKFLQIHTGGPGGFKRTMELLGFGDKVQEITDQPEMAVPLNEEEYIIARRKAAGAFKTRPRDEWIRLFHEADLAALPVLEPGAALKDEQIEFEGHRIELDDADFGTISQAAPAVVYARSPAAKPAPAPRVGQHNDEVRALAAAAARDAGRESPRKRPFGAAMEGVRILDFSSFFACGYGCKLLSDLGADVIKVETLGGEQMRPLPNPFEACNRGKRDIALNLKSEMGQQVIRDLVATADVVVHNMRPGKAEKIGLGYDALAGIKPDLVYGYLPGYGSKGPKTKLKSFAPLLSGFTGLLYEGGGEGNPPAPRVTGNEDYYNGLLGANAILMGLAHRDRTGEGQYFECPQLHSSLFVTSEHFLDANLDVVYGLRLDKDQTGLGPLYRIYRCSDGWVCLACVGERAFGRLRAALGAPLGDARFGSAALRQANSTDLTQLLEQWFAGRTRQDAFDALERHGVACEIVRDEPYVTDIFWEDWAVDGNRVFIHDDSPWGRIREVGLTTHLSDTPGYQKPPAPHLGQHTREILEELGYSAARIAELSDARCLIAAE